MIPTYLTIVEKFFTELDLLLQQFVFDGYRAVMNYLDMPFRLLLILYIILMGYGILQGWLQVSASLVIRAIVTIAFVYLAAFHWDWFSQMVVKGISSAADELAAAILLASPIPLPHLYGEGLNGALQTVLIEVTRIGAWTWTKGGLYHWGAYFDALLIWGFGIALVVVGVYLIALARIMLAVLSVLAPLFIVLCLFSPTRPLFDRWVGSYCSYLLLSLLVSAVLSLALSLFQWSVGGMVADQAMHLSLVGFVPVALVGGLGLGILRHISQLAFSIGGALSSQSSRSQWSGQVASTLARQGMVLLPLLGGSKRWLRSHNPFMAVEPGRQRTIPMASRHQQRSALYQRVYDNVRQGKRI